ncbi:MAG TPA: DUF6496 domain-containing protein [Magnetospirillaceae bacterium]|nr:DUF6496 domain-containing protein [Magnetospirillaceae bacterium]
MPDKKYSKKAEAKISKTLHEFKEGDLHMGKSGKKVKSRKQAVAIAIDKARRTGLKVPKKKS